MRAVIGHPIHPEAATVLERLGGETSNFAARQLTSRIVSEADLVLTMTRAHKKAVLELEPRQLRRTFTLSSAARLVSELGAETIDDLAELRPQLRENRQFDIADPIGGGTEFHASVGLQIATLIPPILKLRRID